MLSRIRMAPDPYRAGVSAGRTALALIREGQASGLRILEREEPWLDIMEASLDAMPDHEDSFIDVMMGEVDVTTFVPQDYELN